MAKRRTKNPLKAWWFLLNSNQSCSFTSYFWRCLNGSKKELCRGIWDYNHPDWEERSPLAINVYDWEDE